MVEANGLAESAGGLKRARSEEKCVPKQSQRPQLNGLESQRTTRNQRRKLGTDLDSQGDVTCVDLSELIAKSSGCSMFDDIEKVLEDTWPPARGNNLSVQLLKETYRALDLGLYTNRKMAIPGMAMMFWLLAGKAGEEAAYEAACAVKNAILPNELKNLLNEEEVKRWRGNLC